MKKKNKDLILLDCETEECTDFIDGLNKSLDIRLEPHSVIANKAHSLLGNVWRYSVYIIYPLFFIFRTSRCVFAWQQFFGLFYSFFQKKLRLIRDTKIIILNFTYKEKTGWKRNAYRKFFQCALNNENVFIHVPSHSYAKICSTNFGISKERILVSHFGLPDMYDAWKDSKTEYDNFTLSIGRSNRDFDFLIEAWKNMPKDEQLVIVSDTYKCKTKLPNNIIHRKDISGDAQFPFIANAKCMIIPIDDGSICSGDTVLLTAMSFAKPIIVTVPSTLAEMYLDDGENAIFVKKNSCGFRNVVCQLFSNHEKMIRLGSNARDKYEKNYSRYRMGLNLGDKIYNYIKQ